MVWHGAGTGRFTLCLLLSLPAPVRVLGGGLGPAQEVAKPQHTHSFCASLLLSLL